MKDSQEEEIQKQRQQLNSSSTIATESKKKISPSYAAESYKLTYNVFVH